MVKGFVHMQPVEIALAKRWAKTEDMTQHRIGQLLQRDPKTIRTALLTKALHPFSISVCFPVCVFLGEFLASKSIEIDTQQCLTERWPLGEFAGIDENK